MISEIVILGKDEAESLTYDSPYVVIGIAEPNSPFADLANDGNRLADLRLRFHDQTPGCHYAFTLCKPSDARKTFEFLEKHPQAKAIVVYCHSGRSRSAAIGRVLARAFGCRLRVRDDADPNPHVERIFDIFFQQVAKR